jgi:hypothetical protein
MTPQEINKILDEAIKQRKMTADFVKGVGPAIVESLKPTLDKIADNSRLPKDEILKAISQIKVNVSDIKVPKPNITIPPIIVPKIDTPIVNYTPPEVKVNVPAIDIRALAAKIQLPNEMNIKGWVGFMGYDRGLLNDPLPVQIRDAKGNPVMFTGGGAVISGGGGVAHQVKINNPTTNPVPVQIVSGASSTSGVNVLDSSGVAYSGSNPLPVVITSGATATSAVQNLDGDGNYRGTFPVEGTVVVSDITASLKASLIDSSGVQYSGSNPVPVQLVSGGTATTAVQNLNADGDYRDTFPVEGTVAVSGITGSVGATILNGEGLARDSWLISDITSSVKASLIDSTGVQYSGSNPFPIKAFGNTAGDGTGNERRLLVDNDGNLQVDVANGVSISGTVLVSDVTASVKSALIDSTGIQYSGSNPVPVKWISGAGATVAANISDSSGVGYSGSNPIPITIVSGALTSTISVGATVSDAVDDGSAPVKGGGIARTANPTAVAGGDIVTMSMDSLGRQLTRPVQVRGLIATAYVAKVTGSTFGTETTLLASGSGVYLDLIYVMGTNDSTAAIKVDLRPSTGGTVCKTIEIPAGGTAGVSLPVPYPAPFVDHTWTIDLPDVTGTNVTISALFSKEV